MARLMRCRVPDMSVRVTGAERGVWMGEGRIVDFDEELAPGFTLGDAVAGREDCFEPVESNPVVTAPAAIAVDDEKE